MNELAQTLSELYIQLDRALASIKCQSCQENDDIRAEARRLAIYWKQQAERGTL